MKDYVLSCADCSKNKKSGRNPKCQMTLYHAGSPMERVHIDFLGPLPKTSRGNEYILMMVDQFTKWVECVALPSQGTEETAHAAVNEFFCRFGYPFYLHSDQGRNFESKLFAHVFELLHIKKTRTTAYRPFANGQVERFNRTLMNAVRYYVKDTTSWDYFLPQIASAMRATINRNTGFTPNKLMLGREVNLPIDLVFPLSSDESVEPDTEDYVKSLRQALVEAHSVARDKLGSTQKVMKHTYDLRVFERSYEKGQLVYILDSSSGKGKNVRCLWKGPGVVLEKITPYLYRVREGNKETTINHDRLKVCLDRDLPKWILRWQAKYADGTLGKDQHCICRKPDDGLLMIQCDDCLDWFHRACVGISLKEARSMNMCVHHVRHDICPFQSYTEGTDG